MKVVIFANQKYKQDKQIAAKRAPTVGPFKARGTAQLQCCWKQNRMKRNPLLVGVLGAGINYDQLLVFFLFKSNVLGIIKVPR